MKFWDTIHDGVPVRAFRPRTAKPHEYFSLLSTPATPRIEAFLTFLAERGVDCLSAPYRGGKRIGEPHRDRFWLPLAATLKVCGYDPARAQPHNPLNADVLLKQKMRYRGRTTLCVHMDGFLFLVAEFCSSALVQTTAQAVEDHLFQMHRDQDRAAQAQYRQKERRFKREMGD